MSDAPEETPRTPKAKRNDPRVAENRTAAESANGTDRIMGSVVDFLFVGIVGPLLLHGTLQTILASFAESTGIRFRELRGAPVAVMVMGLTQFIYFGPYLVWTYRTKRFAAVAVVIVISGITARSRDFAQAFPVFGRDRTFADRTTIRGTFGAIE